MEPTSARINGFPHIHRWIVEGLSVGLAERCGETDGFPHIHRWIVEGIIAIFP